jgi:membrane protease YdiL (CAAX protease family)
MEEIKTWKLWSHFAGYFLCFVLAGVITAIPRFIIGFENESGLVVFITEMLRIPISIALLYFYTKYVSRLELNKETLSTTGFNFWIWGAVGLTLPLAVLLIFYLFGNLNILATNFQLSDEIIFDNVLKALGMSLAAGIIEEVVFRGYLVNLLAKKYSFWVAGIVPSFLFTIVHLGAAHSLLNVFQLLVAGMLVSIMFLAIYKKTGSIWNASIVHFLWNFLFLEELIDYGEGNEPIHKLMELDLGQNQFLTGGAFGLDVSFPAIIIYSITLIITWKFLKQKTAYNKT